MKTDKRLIPFFVKAKSKGWTQGEHLFKYLTEIEMHQYDTIHDTIQRAEGQTEGYNKALQELKEIDDEGLAELFHKEYEKASIAYSWGTQKSCQTDFWNLPESNRKAVIGTVILVKLWLLQKLKPKEADEK